MIGDPNGAIYWKGEYHLFYQNTLEGVVPGNTCWGHATSKDLVYWEDQPIAIKPESGGPDWRACFSGCTVNNDGVPTIVYFGVYGGICIATSNDDLVTWEKSPHNPVIPTPAGDEEYGVHDPFVWKEEDYWYLISGSNLGSPRDVGSSKDAAFMFRSRDMVNWDYMYPLYEPGEESDCATPDFFTLGKKHVLLFASHTLGIQYYVGKYSNQKFIPENHGRMNYTSFGVQGKDMHFSGDLTTPVSWSTLDGRRIMLGWISEGRTLEEQKIAGWAGIMSLPRALSLNEQGLLDVEPIKELEVLRRNLQVVRNVRIGSDSSVWLDKISGNQIELAVQFSGSTTGKVGLNVCCSKDGKEKTSIIYDYSEQQLELNVEHSSLNAEFVGRKSQIVPLPLYKDGVLKLRIFIDRSVVEVFTENGECLTKRIYPSKQDSVGVSVFAKDSDSELEYLKAWSMASVWGW